jgi:hypothetical protein
MPLTKPTIKRSTRRPASKTGAGRLSNSQLLKLAAKHKPPQAWYDQQDDPTKPAPAGPLNDTCRKDEEKELTACLKQLQRRRATPSVA